MCSGLEGPAVQGRWRGEAAPCDSRCMKPERPATPLVDLTRTPAASGDGEDEALDCRHIALFQGGEGGETERATVADQLRGIGRAIDPARPDGKCLFHVVRMMGGIELSEKKLIKLAVDGIRKRLDVTCSTLGELPTCTT